MSRCDQCVDGRCVRDVFPVFLKLCDKAVLVVGAGAVAAEKVPALVQAGARVTVVAPEIGAAVRGWSDRVHIVERPFRDSDLDSAWYVLAAAPPAVNRAVGRAASRQRVFVNAVDDVASADVFLGSVLRRAGMTFAISSNGAAPALTALVRRGLEQLLPDELEGWLALAAGLRPRWKAAQLPLAERRPALLQAINRWYEQSEAAR
jgi:siroheme synthase-like protein